MSSSVKAFERSVSRVYNQTKRDKPELNYTHSEFTEMCKIEFYQGIMSMNVTDGGKAMGERYSRHYYTLKKGIIGAASINKALARLSVPDASRIGTTIATCLTNTV